MANFHIFSLGTLLRPVHTEPKRTRKRKRSKNNRERSKISGKHQRQFLLSRSLSLGVGRPLHWVSLQRVKIWKETTCSKWVIVVMKLVNIAVTDLMQRNLLIIVKPYSRCTWTNCEQVPVYFLENHWQIPERLLGDNWSSFFQFSHCLPL